MQRRMNLVLLLILTLGLFAAGVVFSIGEGRRVQEEQLEQAQLLMTLANITRNYTNDEVRGLFDYTDGPFHKASVPSYASRRITEALLDQPEYQGYSVREAALAPINVNNRADEFEAGIIRGFQEQAKHETFDPTDLPTVNGMRVVEGGVVFYLAEPIVLPPDDRFHCLDCHGAEADAPAGMLTQYPGAAGFEWKEGEVVGAQVVTVPVSLANKHKRERMATLLVALLSVFTLIYAALNFLLSRGFLIPMRRVTDLADQMSRGQPAEWLNESLPGEQGKLAAAINRLKRSQDKALEVAAREEPSQDSDRTHA